MPPRDPTERLFRRTLRQESPYGEIHDGYSLFDNFERLVAASQLVSTNNNFDLAGSAGTQAINLTYGGQDATTGTSDDDAISFFPLATSAWNINADPGSSFEFFIEWQLRTTATISTMAFFAGLKLTNAVDLATDGDAALIYYDTDDGANLRINQSVSGTDTETDLGSNYAVAANTRYRLGVQIPSDLIPRFYVNGALVHTGSAFDGGENLKPFFGLATRTGAARVMTTQWVRLYKNEV